MFKNVKTKAILFLRGGYRIFKVSYLKFKARLLKKVFACRALHGDSNYNICINSDMTVSCNCQDYDGSGHIGDMRQQTFKEIFFGQQAQSFRKSLSRCKLPVSACWACGELILVNHDEIEKYLNTTHLPTKGIMLENTVLCNLSCLGCNRKILLRTRGQKSMSIKDIESISSELGKMAIDQISFFNLGEPFLSQNVSEELKILRNGNPKAQIITSTNGYYLDSQKKRESALLLDHIYFSIDGCSQETMSKYQVGGVFDVTYKNLKQLVEERKKLAHSRTVIEWKYVVFRWNDKPSYIKKAIALAEEAEVDIISFWLGGADPSYRSYRYKYHPFYKSLGSKSWKGREVDFRKLHK